MSLTIREEKILEAAIAGEQSPIEPVTRREAIFTKATGADIELPPARNKEEDILSKLAVGYSGGGGGGDFGAAEVTITNNTEFAISVYGYLVLQNISENFSIIGTTQEGSEVADAPVTISTYYDIDKHSVMTVDGASSISDCVGCEVVNEFDGSFSIAITNNVASFAAN